MEDYYLSVRIITYSLLILVSLFRLLQERTRVVILILIYAQICLLTDFLDVVYISSNLELYSIFNLCRILIIYFLISPQFSNRLILYLSFGFFVLITGLAFLGTYNFEFLNSHTIYTSNYGFLDTYENNLLLLIQTVVVLPLLFFAVYKAIATPTTKSQVRYYATCFAFILSYAGMLFSTILGNFIILDFKLFIEISTLILYTVFLLSNGFLLGGLLWKK